MTKPILSFKIERIFNRGLFADDDVRTAIANADITEDMRSKKVALLSDAQAVERIQNGPQAYKDALIGGRFGIVRHEGAAPTGNQLGKLEFLRREMNQILTSGASPDAQKYAMLNLHQWATALSYGLVTGADGKPMPVMGNTGYAGDLSQAPSPRRPPLRRALWWWPCPPMLPESSPQPTARSPSAAR